jgi:exopolysaccharide biosynthesis polyprenyl glycosylphosphotransferase
MIPRRLFWILDFTIVAFAFCLAYALWPSLHHVLASVRWEQLPAVLRPQPVTADLPPFRPMIRMVVLAGVAAIIALHLVDGYRPMLQQTRARVIFGAVIAPVAAAGVITLFLFFENRTGWSRLLLSSFILCAIISVSVFRLSLRSYFESRRAAGFYKKNVLLVGPRAGVLWLSNYFSENVPEREYRVTGYLGVQGDDSEEQCCVTLAGQAWQLRDILITQPIHEIIAVQPNGSAEWLPDVIETCDSLGILLRIIPQGLLFGKRRILRTLYPFQLLNLPAIVLAPPNFDSDALFFKRVFDIIVSAGLLILLSPLFAVIAVAIKLADRKSDVFYRWNVVGRNGVRFTGYKFTTMYVDAYERRVELLDRNEMTGPVFKMKNDPRVTPLGKFLRKFSLNELPQLWSVLKGDMSLVGPRPAFPHELEEYGFWHKRKLSIRPGITCLWQVRGRNKISNFDDWVKMDLEYIDNWSLWLDFKILVRTAWAVVAGTGS